VVTIIKDIDVDLATAASLADGYHKLAIKKGLNFASVNISYSDADRSTTPWCANHLDILATGLTTKEVAEKIYKWLCKSRTKVLR
jgi:hypothetical protein